MLNSNCWEVFEEDMCCLVFEASFGYLDYSMKLVEDTAAIDHLMAEEKWLLLSPELLGLLRFLALVDLQ